MGVEDAFKLGEGAEGLDGCLIGDVLAMGPSGFGSATASVTDGCAVGGGGGGAFFFVEGIRSALL